MGLLRVAPSLLVVVGIDADVETNIRKVTREVLNELELCRRSSRVFMLEAEFVVGG